MPCIHEAEAALFAVPETYAALGDMDLNYRSSFELFMPEVVRFARPNPLRDPVTGVTNGRWALTGYSEDKIVARFVDRPDEEIAEVKFAHWGADGQVLAAAADLYRAARSTADPANRSAGGPNVFVMTQLEAVVWKAEGVNEEEDLELCVPHPAAACR